MWYLFYSRTRELELVHLCLSPRKKYDFRVSYLTLRGLTFSEDETRIHSVSDGDTSGCILGSRSTVVNLSGGWSTLPIRSDSGRQSTFSWVTHNLWSSVSGPIHEGQKGAVLFKITTRRRKITYCWPLLFDRDHQESGRRPPLEDQRGDGVGVPHTLQKKNFRTPRYPFVLPVGRWILRKENTFMMCVKIDFLWRLM